MLTSLLLSFLVLRMTPSLSSLSTAVDKGVPFFSHSLSHSRGKDHFTSPFNLRLRGNKDDAKDGSAAGVNENKVADHNKSNVAFIVALTMFALGFVLLHAGFAISCLPGGVRASMYNGLFVIDQTSLLAVIITSIIIAWYTSTALVKQSHNELALPNLALIIIMVIAMISIATSNDILSLIVAVETQSLALYILVAFPGSKPVDAGVAKPARARLGLLYLLNASVATAVLLIGLSYDLNLLVAIGLLWKLGAWPVHAWLMPLTDALDKYTATLLLTVTKLGLIVYLAYLTTGKRYILYIGIGNLLIGSIIALIQRRYIRLFAWLSLTQLGYVLLAISFDQTANALLYFMLYCTFTALLLLVNDMPIQTLANSYKQIGLGLLLAYTINLYATAGLPSAPIFWVKLELLLLANSQSIALALVATLISSLVYVRLIRYASFYSYALH